MDTTDTIEFEGEEYDLVGVHGEGLFSPEQYGLGRAGRWTSGSHSSSFVNVYRVEGDRLLLSAVWSQYREVEDNPFGVRAKIYIDENNRVSMWPVRYEGLSWPMPFRGRVLLGRDLVESCRIHGYRPPAWAYGKVVELFFDRWGVLVWQRDVSMEMGLTRDVFTEAKQRLGAELSEARGRGESGEAMNRLLEFADEHYPYNDDYKWEYIVTTGVPVEMRAAVEDDWARSLLVEQLVREGMSLDKALSRTYSADLTDVQNELGQLTAGLYAQYVGWK
jgi:hypothetical protein